MRRLIFFLVLPTMLFGASIISTKVASPQQLKDLLLQGYDVLNYDKKSGQTLIYVKSTNNLDFNFTYLIENTKEWWDKSTYKMDFGPYYTYNEAISEMDNLHNQYPHIIGEKFPIGTTIEGRTIWAFEVTHFNGEENTRPSVLYEAAIHAREPGGVSTLFGFVWHLARNYGKDLEITELLNSRRLYFIPIVNPDGYVYNEISDGYWRKNKRDNDNDGIFEEDNDGVDLNRNFGYQWGYDDVGSSPNPSSSTYRGQSPFSEPESQAIKNFTDSIQPKIAIDYHTYSNLLMFPWGYENIPTQDDNILRAFAEKLTTYNGYRIGRPGELLYNANGVTIDWWYNDSTHPKILAYTAEVGEDFWQPDTGIILEQIEENIPLNILLAKMAGQWIDLENYDGDTLYLERHKVRVINTSAISLFNGGTFTILEDSLQRYDITCLGASSFTLSTLGIMPNDNDTILEFALSLPDTYSPGWINMFFNITSTNYTSTKCVPMIIGEIPPLFSIDFESGYSDFQTNHWDTTNSTYHSPNYSITDSKTGNYSNNDTSYLEFNDILDLSDTTALYYITFYTKYELEEGYDYAYFQIRDINENTWITLKTFNDTANWHQVSINLEDYRGKQLKFRFYMTTDVSVTYDGIYVDDIKFKKIPQFSPITGVQEHSHKTQINFGINRIIFQSAKEQILKIKIINVNGRVVETREVLVSKGLNTLTFERLKPGKYTVLIGEKRYQLIIDKP